VEMLKVHLSRYARELKQSPLWVKVGRTQREHMSSGLPLKADVARCSWHVAKVPIATFRNTDLPTGACYRS
jgi:hypothetical protein